jgi:hypothetical protein
MADESQTQTLNFDQISIKIDESQYQTEIELTTLENEDSKSIYHEIFNVTTQTKFLLNLVVLKKFHADYSSKSSRKFLIFASKLEKELNEIFPEVQFTLRSILKIGHARRKIFVTLACQVPSSEMNVKNFERKLRNLIFVRERLKKIRVSFWDMKCKEVNEEEFEHFKKFGFDLCGSCGEKF